MKITPFLFVLVLSSCINHSIDEKVEVVKTIKQTSEINFAKGFSIDDSNEAYTLIRINSNDSKFNFSDSIYLAHSDKFDATNKKVLPNNLDALALQSTTYLSFLSVLNKLESVKGLAGLQYLNSNELTKVIHSESVIEIGSNGSVLMESLLKVNPDLFLIYPFELDNKEKYNSKGVETLLISEYLESTPLARLEWIKLFGMILNETEVANTYFNEVVSEYESRKIEMDSAKTMFFNLPFKESWNMPNSNSITANLVQDAGFNYIFSDTINDNTIRSKENVWNKAMDSEYWVIIASRPEGFTMDDLKAEEAIYAEFPAVKNNRVLFCNTTTTDYFTMGVVEPEVMLKDLLNYNDSNYVSKYFKVLK